MAKDDVLENGKRVLDGAPPQLHRRRGSTLLHALQSRFMHVPMDDAARAGCALRLESAGSAHLRAGEIDERALVPAVTA